MMFKTHSLSCLLLLCGGLLCAQMTPNAPVKNFKLPRFGDEGFTQWVLQGERGIYDSEAQVRVEAMALRVYSGDERMARELILESPQATIRLQENRAFSEALIGIEGANFTISGLGWEWQGDKKEIRVAANTEVEFAQNISGGMSASVEGPGQTSIVSDQLMLKTTETEYEFEFTGAVRASSGDWQLTSETLIALADAPEGNEGSLGEAGKGQLDSVRKIVAREDVVFQQGARTVRAGEAEFFTGERRVILRGTPSIEVVGAYLTGERIESRAGEVVIRGSPGGGRAQMILLDTGGLGLQGSSALSSETIVLANSIRLEETPESHQFFFEGKVEVLSGAVQLSASTLTVSAVRLSPALAAANASESLQLGQVSEMVAKGAVRIEQSGQVATGEKVVFFPEDQRAVLTGAPTVSDGGAVVTGDKMELQPKRAIVRGQPGEPLQVKLPELPNLGYAGMADLGSGGTNGPDDQAETEAVETMIRSQLLNRVEGPEGTVFRFTGSVEVTATNLEGSCERMDVMTATGTSGSGPSARERDPLPIERIEAHGNLRIEQAGRKARADRGTILPGEGQLILEGNASVEDAQGKVAGHRLTLMQGQRRALIEGGGPEKERARMTLPPLSKGSFK